eukprot:TRINITY_DN2325_c0_g1_i2.p1 TRINITY_DN2325_c0_g1~~TRINITY_DN2325_c0_g1_i2.p1  ORF type:complete len:304 (-),score=53.87 TRINITY_DN2325_c0_g1_i2:118-1029(-)
MESRVWEYFSFFGKSNDQDKTSSSIQKKQGKKILVIDANPKHNWYKIFEGSKGPDNLPVIVEQAAWGDIQATAYSTGKINLDIRASGNPIPDSPQTRFRIFSPDIVLIRNGPLEIEADHVNLLFAFQYAQIPAVNSVNSVYQCRHRPWVFAELIKIRNRVGQDKFPLIDQYLYTSHREILATPTYPIVLKVSHAHAGYGKIKVETYKDLDDVRSVVALHKDYITAESFVKNSEYDLRIQKIGDNITVFKRVSISGNWKTNTGTSILEEIKVSERHKMWVDECTHIFGGLDIFAVGESRQQQRR